MTPAQLITQHKDLIEFEVRKYSTHVAQAAVRMEAYKLAQEQAKDFDAKSGTKFSTFLTSRLQKLSRLSTQYGGLIRIPEEKQYKMHKTNKTFHTLEAEYGRPPTVQEVASRTGQSLLETKTLLSGRHHSVNLNDNDSTAIFTAGQNDEWVHFVYHDLPPTDKLIFEHKTGFGGKPLLDNHEIATKLHLSQSTVSKRIGLIGEQLGKGMA